MSQRNPMNERYTSEDRRGTTRKSAASAKPKSKAASSVTVVPGKKVKTKQEIKAEQREEERKRREFNNRYYKPDTLRYKRLRIVWWVLLVLAIGCCALAFVGQDFLPGQVGVVVLVLTYVFLIAAFVIDLWPVRKERNAYQARMREVEAKREKAERAARQAEQAKRSQAAKKKGSGKNQNRHAAQKQGGGSAEDDAAEVDGAASDEAPAKPARRGLFGSGFRLSNREKMQAEKKAAKEAKAAEKAEEAE